MNMLITSAIAAFIPLLIGFVWYNPKVFGNAWMKAAGLTEESMKGANMALVFGLTYFFGFLIAFGLHSITIHQFGVLGLLQPEQGYTDPEGAITSLTELAKVFEHKFRTFRHGMIHGTINGIAILLPVVAINGLFERRGWKYILINAGYWILSTALMGGVICQFSK